MSQQNIQKDEEVDLGNLFKAIGKGLQNIFKDLVSGLFVLFEGSLKIGDIIEADGVVGKVEEINLRSSEVVTRDDVIIIIPNSKVFVTPLLIYSCITIFIIMIFNNVHVMYPDGRDLIDFGSIHGNSIENGEWWRLITGIFLHAGIWHLVLNMVHIFLLGGSFEEVIGKFKFLLVFMITGVLASYISFSCNISVNSVGASGAIFGLYGFILTLFLTKDKITQSMNFVLPTIIALASINLILGLFEGSVDNAAHIGGFVSGVILGLMQYGYNRFASH